MTALLVIVIPMIAACVICFVLGACWQAGRADEQAEEAERAIRYAEHRPCPWDLKP